MEPAPTPRHLAFQQLSATFRRLAAVERTHAMDQLRRWCGGDVPAHDARPLSTAEIHHLVSTDLIEIGAHTRTHAWLATMPLVSQAREISESKAMLENITGAPVVSFAYPYGGPRDFTQETTAVVREAGFECGCTGIAGIVNSRADPFQLRRMHPLNWNGDELAARLCWWAASQG